MASHCGSAMAGRWTAGVSAGKVNQGVSIMLKNRRTRRITAGVLLVLGGLLMLLAPEMWIGVLVLVLGVALEVAGIALERRS
jgi:uncharacterized membrane protein HdeD (DUF308 family)